MKHRFLAKRLDAAADRLTTRVLNEMYADAFWSERFGERAELHGRKDGRFHIDYLIQALHADDAGVMESYARWLQPVLTSRGMCTRHLDENFWRLAAAIRSELWTDGDAAIRLLDAARAALIYPPGPAHDVQREAGALARAAATAGLEQIELLVDYIADAIALGQPDVFAKHVIWLAGFLERHAQPRHSLIESLTLIAKAAPSVVPAAADELRSVIEPALAALANH